MALLISTAFALGTAYQMGQQMKKGVPAMGVDVHFFINHMSKIEILIETPNYKAIVNNGEGSAYLALYSESRQQLLQYPSHWGQVQVPMIGTMFDIASPHKEFSFTVL
jgi:hypothetical protein